MEHWPGCRVCRSTGNAVRGRAAGDTDIGSRGRGDRHRRVPRSAPRDRPCLRQLRAIRSAAWLARGPRGAQRCSGSLRSKCGAALQRQCARPHRSACVRGGDHCAGDGTSRRQSHRAATADGMARRPGWASGVRQRRRRAARYRRSVFVTRSAWAFAGVSRPGASGCPACLLCVRNGRAGLAPTRA